MGIRFYCPNGHKLNVKTFLAGKRGICPHCGERFEIPAESVRTASKKKSSQATLIQQVDAAAGAGSSASFAADGGVATLASPIISGGVPITVAAGRDKQLAAVAAEKPLLKPVEIQPTAQGTSNGAKTPLADPIAEAPAAVWYVRPAAGGQFGPAAGDVMRQWLSQRRVGADSMVWREGWADWKRADGVFPLLFASTAEAGDAESAGTSNFADDGEWVDAMIDTKPAVGSHSAAHPPRAKGKPNNTLVIVSIFLILLCVLLVIVMATVFMQEKKNDASDSSSSISAPATYSWAEMSFSGNHVWPLVEPSATS